MNSNHRIPGLRELALIPLCLLLITTVFALPSRAANAQDEEPQFTSEFRIEDCDFRPRGENPYFILQPGYQLIFEGEEDGETIHLEITVLNKTETIDLPEIGEVRTRVVEEVETADGELTEISKNFFAICKQTNDVYYFGEEVDIYNEDGTITHEGAWRAGEPDEDGVAEPGIIMPGTFLLGSRYYQELADGIALGTFTDCVQVIETTPLEPGSESEKIYCPEVGLTVDNSLELIQHSFIEPDDDDDHQ
jgi:hypothetical protein